MPHGFDPYYKWLAIPPEEQPPDYYRLLGVARFESDAEVIAVAADRQMTHVRAFASGKYADLSQQLLNELSQARLCLLKPEAKAAYDAKLHKDRGVEPQPPADGGGSLRPGSVGVGDTVRGGTTDALSDSGEIGFADEDKAERRRRLLREAASSDMDLKLEPIVDSTDSVSESLAAGGWISPQPADLGDMHSRNHQKQPQGKDPSPAAQPAAPATPASAQPARPLEPHLPTLQATPDQQPLEVEGARVDRAAVQASQWLIKQPDLPFFLQSNRLPQIVICWTLVTALLSLAAGQILFSLLLAVTGSALVTLAFVPALLSGRSEIDRFFEAWGRPAIVGCLTLATAIPVTCSLADLLEVLPESFQGRSNILALATISLALAVMAGLLAIGKCVAHGARRLGLLPAATLCFYVLSLPLTFAGTYLVQGFAEARWILAQGMASRSLVEQAAGKSKDDQNRAQPRTPPVIKSSTGKNHPPGLRPDTEKKPADQGSRRTDWNAVADPLPDLPRKLAAFESMQLDAKPGEIRGVTFAGPVAARAVMMAGPVDDLQLHIYDLTGAMQQRATLVASWKKVYDVNQDGDYLVWESDRQAGLWAIGRERSDQLWGSSRLALPLRWAHIHERTRMLAIDARQRLVGWHTRSDERYLDLPAVLAAATSPGGRYLVTFRTESSGVQGKVYRPADGELLCQLAASGEIGFLPTVCAFRQDGRLLSAAGGKRLVTWDFTSGEVHSVHRIAANPRTLNYVRPNWIALDGRMINVDTGAAERELTFAFEHSHWSQVPQGLDQRLWVVAARSPEENARLCALDVGVAKEAQHVEDLAFLKEYHARIVHPYDARAVKHKTFSSAADYVRNVYVDLIARDVNQLDERLQWWPAAKRPVMGLRWGIGLYHEGKTSGYQPERKRDQSKRDFLHHYTGEIGTRLLEGLEQRSARGDFGIWPPAGDPELRSVLVAAGRPAEIRAEALAAGIDIVIWMQFEDELLAGKPIGRTMKIYITPAGESFAASSVRALITQRELQKHPGRAESVAQRLLQEIDREHKLVAIDSASAQEHLSADEIARRVESLRREEVVKPAYFLARLLELRFYQRLYPKHPDIHWPSLYRHLLGEGQPFVEGTPQQRLKVLRRFLEQ